MALLLHQQLVVTLAAKVVVLEETPEVVLVDQVGHMAAPNQNRVVQALSSFAIHILHHNNIFY
jgi:hypothetical protein